MLWVAEEDAEELLEKLPSLGISTCMRAAASVAIRGKKELLWAVAEEELLGEMTGVTSSCMGVAALVAIRGRKELLWVVAEEELLGEMTEGMSSSMREAFVGPALS